MWLHLLNRHPREVTEVSGFQKPTERVIPVDHVFGPADPNEPESKRRGRVIVGVLGGLAIGLLLAAGSQLSSPDSDETPSSIPEVAAPPTVPTTLATTTTLAPSRLDILVDEYEGTLYLVGFVNSQAKLWRWESRTGSPLSLELPDRTFWASFNSSQVRVGVLAASNLSAGYSLWVGTPGNLEPLAVDISDYAWHATDPSQIAWIEERVTGDSTSIFLRTATLPAVANTSVSIEQSGRLVKYDHGGVLLETISDAEGFVIWAVDLGGEEIGRILGRFLGLLPDGRVLISQAGELVVTQSDLSDPQAFEFPSDKRMAGVSTSPTAGRWAIWEIEETTGVSAPAQLWVLENDEVVFETTLPSTLRAVSWSHDGRFLVTAAGEPSPLSGFSTGNLWFIDTEDWSMHQVAAPGFVFNIAAVP